jgi:hypothetical protein
MSGCVVTEEGAPSLGRRPASLDHVLRDAGLRDFEAELEQLAMDARRTPQRIFRAYPPDRDDGLILFHSANPTGSNFRERHGERAALALKGAEGKRLTYRHPH